MENLFAPLPDELLRTHLGRLRVENSARDDRDLACRLALGPLANPPSAGRLILLRRLAERIGSSAELLVRRHTLVPFRRCVHDGRFVAGVSIRFDDDYFLGQALCLGAYPRLCRKCVAEDLSFRGIAYWRRTHQLRGITWCVKHQTPLTRMLVDVPTRITPQRALGSGQSTEERDVKEAVTSPVVRRYAEVVQGILENLDAPVSQALLAKVVRKRASDLGLRVTKGRGVRLLSQEGWDRIPTRWLATHFPRTYESSAAEGWVDRVGTGYEAPPSASCIALALALLWEDADDAVSSVMNERRKAGQDCGFHLGERMAHPA